MNDENLSEYGNFIHKQVLNIPAEEKKSKPLGKGLLEAAMEINMGAKLEEKTTSVNKMQVLPAKTEESKENKTISLAENNLKTRGYDSEKNEQKINSEEKKAENPNNFVKTEEDASEFILAEDFEEQGTLSELERLELFKQLAEDKKALLEEKREILAKEKIEKKAKKAQLRAMTVRRPIGIKLIAIVSLLLIIALGGTTYFTSYFTTEDVRTSAEENNLVINSRTALDCSGRISSAVSAVEMLTDVLGSNEDITEVLSLESMFFERNPDIAAIYVVESRQLLAGAAFLASREIPRELVESYFYQETSILYRAMAGSFELQNSSPFFGVPLLTIAWPIGTGREANAVAILYSSDALGESFASGSINQSFFVNDDGAILIHSDSNLVMEGAEVKNSPIIQAMHSSPLDNGQITYNDESGEEYIGAFHRLSLGNGGIVTIVRTATVLEGVNATIRRNIYITLAILAISILIVYWFSRSLSAPLKQLTEVAAEINKGNFNTELFGSLKAKGGDEVGVLVNSTKNEREILNTVTKLTNRGVTNAIITKQIDFEPHLKDITIFFSDIRGFTAISDGFKNRFGDKSAAEIIGFLNDYMSRMVTCITKTGGTVDKFEGDAIMACWGVLRHETLDWETLPKTSVTRAIEQDAHDHYVKEDALSAITCCIAMRYSLMKYNKDAENFTRIHADEPLAQYKPHIRIGAGLNSGRATVGFMGSFDKMEFTSIGDDVNLASRTEASNKPCGTDILITESTYSLLRDDFIRCPENNFTLKEENENKEVIVEQIPVTFEVKGKGKQHFYGVVNMPKFDIKKFFGEDDPSFELDPDCMLSVGPKGPRTLSEVRSLLGIPEPNFGQVNLDEEENKVNVSAS